jgi:small nuclear ribonucleoprotein (snRNP)-like protein
MFGSSSSGLKRMNQNDLQLLKASVDKLVRIHCRDGEVLVARVHFVSDEYKDLIYDVVSTNQKARYEKHGQQAAYTVGFQDIESVEPVPDSPQTDGNAEENQ